MASQPPMPPPQQYQHPPLSNPAEFTRPPLFQSTVHNGNGQLPLAEGLRYPAPSANVSTVMNSPNLPPWNQPLISGQGSAFASTNQLFASPQQTTPQLPFEMKNGPTLRHVSSQNAILPSSTPITPNMTPNTSGN